MKRLVEKLSLVLLMTVSVCGASDYAYSGKSFYSLSAIDPFQLSYPARIADFRTDKQYAKECGWGGAVQVVGLWQQTSDSDNFTRYFFPDGKCSLVAGEYSSGAATAHSTDLLANYFGVFTAPVSPDAGVGVPSNLTFQSTLKMCPKHKQYGVGLTWQQRLWKCFWADVSTSIVQVTNKLNFNEKIENYGAGLTPDGSYSTMTAALASDRLNYGRISNCDMKKSGVADVEFRLGWEKDICDCCGVGGLYLGGIIPTGNKPGDTKLGSTVSTTATSKPCDWGRYMFEPIVGNNHHWGIFFGSYGRIELFQSDSGCPLTLATDCTVKYLAQNTQKRSFDLKGKPWSRYIHTWNDKDAVAADLTVADLIPLINYTTLSSKVTPGWSVDWNSALTYQMRCWGFEVGCNVFAREGEKVCPCANLQSGLGLADLYAWAAGAPDAIRTASLETIATDNWGNAVDVVSAAVGTSTYLTILQSDLDVMSASAPPVFNGTFYGALSFDWDNCRLPVFLNAGGSYTFTSDNGSPDNWVAWVKLGVSF